MWIIELYPEICYSKADLLKMRGEQAAMIFQDTSRYLNPISRVGKPFDAFLKYHVKMDTDEMHALEEDLLQRVRLQDVDRVLTSYPFELSGGMRHAWSSRGPSPSSPAC